MTMYAQTPPRQQDAAKRRKDRIVRTTIVTFGTIFVIAMSYGSGMRAQGKRLEREHENYKIARSDLRLTQMDLQARDALIQQLEARRQITLALTALETKDTAGAKVHLSEAATRLKTADTVQAATAINLPNLSEKVRQIADKVATNADSTKAEVGAIARAMDTQFPTTVPKPDAMAPVTVKPPTANDVPTMPGNDVTTTDIQPEPAQSTTVK